MKISKNLIKSLSFIYFNKAIFLHFSNVIITTLFSSANQSKLYQFTSNDAVSLNSKKCGYFKPILYVYLLEQEKTSASNSLTVSQVSLSQLEFVGLIFQIA